MNRAFTIFVTIVATVFTGQATVNAQTTAAQPAAAPAATGHANKTPPFKKEELEAIVAPIALYPDALLAQIFMASTYPLEIVEAARWVQGQPQLSRATPWPVRVQKQTWDPEREVAGARSRPCSRR